MLSRLAACFTARLRGSRFSTRVKMAGHRTCVKFRHGDAHANDRLRSGFDSLFAKDNYDFYFYINIKM